MTRMITGDKSAAYAASYIGGGLSNLGPYGYSAAAAPKSLIEPPDPSTLPRLGPMVGRSVQIRTDAGTDLAKGLRLLDVICARNRVRGDHNKQKYHERPGLKRKRLASERWRKRFMDGFKATVSRVQYLKRQGW
ncbi:Ribosomal protein S21 [Neofusicoccum parvum]|uniref:Ribosomal protein S21 n=2 Tax=Neofusicoccum parvum TaxID=310453 RepID=A0ACB5S0B0_9PEZI|nr:putative ribosomal protein s21 protein [Neofusicoccum parvum UCRNP2]GME26209.1 Ribosomal protein S21 [Neofusicoccum parvum]GME38125.1 Ribosomal protein S21 [Neofusicoccum parvum]